MKGGNRKPVTVAVGHLVTDKLYWSAKLCSPLTTSVVDFRKPLRRHKCLLCDQTISRHSNFYLSKQVAGLNGLSSLIKRQQFKDR
jgi:hypothetical protein